MIKEDALTLIENEIASIQTEERFLGVSKWALITAGATLLWLLLSYFQDNKINFTAALTSLTFLLVFWDFTSLLRSILFPISIEENSSRFFTTAELLATAKGALYTLFRSGTTIYLIIKYYRFSIFIVPTVVFYLSIFFVSGAIFVYYIFDFPLNKTRAKRKNNNIFYIFAVLSTLIFLVTNRNFFILEFANILNLKIALLICVISFLVQKYIQLSQTDPLFASLNKVRRDLNFNYIEADSAVEQVDLIVYGRQVNSFFQERLALIIGLFENVGVQFASLDRLLTKIEQSASQSSFDKESYNEIGAILDQTTHTIGQVKIQNEQLIRNCSFYAHLFPHLKKDIQDQVLNKVLTKADEIGVAMDKTRERYDAVMQNAKVQIHRSAKIAEVV